MVAEAAESEKVQESAPPEGLGQVTASAMSLESAKDTKRRSKLRLIVSRTLDRGTDVLHAFEGGMQKNGCHMAWAVLMLSAVLFPFQVRVLVKRPQLIRRLSGLEHAEPHQLVVGAGFWFLARDIPSVLTTRVVIVLILVWGEAWLKGIAMCILHEHTPDDYGEEPTGYVVFWQLSDTSRALAYLFWFRLFWVRVPTLSSISKAATFRIRSKLFPLIIAAWVLGIPYMTRKMIPLPTDVAKWLWPLLIAAFIVVIILILFVATNPLAVVAAEAQHAGEHFFRNRGATRQAQECQMVSSSARWQQFAIIAGISSGLARMFVNQLVPKYNVIFSGGDDLVVLFSYFAFVGVFSGGLAAARLQSSATSARTTKWSAAREEFAAEEEAYVETSVDSRSKWCTVKELSTRGFTLDVLLTFYAGLGNEFMLHWDHSKHTTADVVRQAILPCSAHKRCASSTILMEGTPSQPQKMVTHSWGNRFKDLVAAIVADALGETGYGPVAYLLECDIGALRQWLTNDGKLYASYWVCAASVNQHATICHHSPEWARDTVTRQSYPVCCCGLPKLTNKDAACEVDKFDVMMRMLSAKDAMFSQVVAIDASYTIFTRAWCVAELAAANAAGMPQQLKVLNVEGFECRQQDLRGLRIQDMESSYAPDKEAILRKIGNESEQDAFNEALQHLLFEELLPAWSSIDAEHQLYRLASMTRWHQLGVVRGSAGLYRARMATE